MSKDVNFINLDEMAKPVNKRVRVFNEDHELVELTIGNFGKAIELQKRLNDVFEAGENFDPAVGLDTYVDLIKITIPTLTEDQIRSLNLAQWMGLVEFITTLGFEDAPDEVESPEMGKSEEATGQ